MSTTSVQTTNSLFAEIVRATLEQDDLPEFWD
jgi:hypothetical protein